MMRRQDQPSFRLRPLEIAGESNNKILRQRRVLWMMLPFAGARNLGNRKPIRIAYSAHRKARSLIWSAAQPVLESFVDACRCQRSANHLLFGPQFAPTRLDAEVVYHRRPFESRARLLQGTSPPQTD